MPPSLTILGPVPPPFGGVSIHIVRMRRLLEAMGVRTEVIPYTGLRQESIASKLLQAVGMLVRIPFRVLSRRPDVLHIHYGGMGFFLALSPLLAGYRGRLVLTFHSVRVLQDLAHLPAPLRPAARRLLRQADLFVCVRPGIAEELAQGGLDGVPATVMPAFLPPAADEADISRLPADLAQRLRKRAENGVLQVACAAYYLGPGYGRDDLYGVEALVKALACLDGDLSRPLVLYVLVSNPATSEERRAAEQRIVETAIGLRLVTVEIHQGIPLIPLLARCAGFLRPSREDGDSVAVREALALGVPVLASDVVPRPAGVSLCRLEPPADFADTLGRFLAELTPWAGTGPRPVREQEGGELMRFAHLLVDGGTGN